MLMKKCVQCGTRFSEEQSSGEYCFRCKVGSIRFGFRGPTRAGREHWNNTTIGEEMRATKEARERMGTTKDFEYVGEKHW